MPKRNEKTQRSTVDNDDMYNRNREASSSSTFQKRESGPINREEASDARGSGSRRSQYMRGNMQDFGPDYDSRNMPSRGMQDEYGSDRGSAMRNEPYEERYQQGRNYGHPNDQYHRENFTSRGQHFNHREDDRNAQHGNYYNGPYNRERSYDDYEDRGPRTGEREWQRRFPEDENYTDYIQHRYHTGYNRGMNRESSYGNERGYRENQGQYSADNYGSPVRGSNPRGMNYGPGRDESYDDRGNDRYPRKNYDGAHGGYNEERDIHTSRYGNSRYRDQSRMYEGEGNYPGNGSRGYSEDWRDSNYYRDPERENRYRNQRENDLW